MRRVQSVAGYRFYRPDDEFPLPANVGRWKFDPIVDETIRKPAKEYLPFRPAILLSNHNRLHRASRQCLIPEPDRAVCSW